MRYPMHSCSITSIRVVHFLRIGKPMDTNRWADGNPKPGGEADWSRELWLCGLCMCVTQVTRHGHVKCLWLDMTLWECFGDSGELQEIPLASLRRPEAKRNSWKATLKWSSCIQLHGTGVIQCRCVSSPSRLPPVCFWFSFHRIDSPIVIVIFWCLGGRRGGLPKLQGRLD